LATSAIVFTVKAEFKREKKERAQWGEKRKKGKIAWGSVCTVIPLLTQLQRSMIRSDARRGGGRVRGRRGKKGKEREGSFWKRICSPLRSKFHVSQAFRLPTKGGGEGRESERGGGKKKKKEKKIRITWQPWAMLFDPFRFDHQITLIKRSLQVALEEGGERKKVKRRGRQEKRGEEKGRRIWIAARHARRKLSACFSG